MPGVDADPVGRRAVLRAGAIGAGLLLVPGSLGVVAGACSSPGGPPEDAGPLLLMGWSLSETTDGDRLAASLPEGVAEAPVDEDGARAALAAARPVIERDFAEGRTVLGRGWLLADAEGAILVAYARS